MSRSTRSTITRPIEHRHLPAARDLRPEPPEERPELLVLERRGDGVDLHPARVEPLDELLDGVALAGRVPPLEEDEDRDLRLEGRPLEFPEMVAQFRKRLLVRILVYLLFEIERFQHRSPRGGRMSI
jgi:hypothetical protein